MQTFSANIQVRHNKHTWTIPITIEVSFRQTFRETFETPAEYEVNDYHFSGIGHTHELFEHLTGIEKLVEQELYNNDLENVELL